MNFTPQQEIACDCRKGPLLVIAGAGSGKTRVLTERIRRLVQVDGESPSRIIAITFTRKAAREMRDRLEATIPAARSITISTFHSFCLGLIQTNLTDAGFTGKVTVYDDVDLEALKNQVMLDLGKDGRNRWEEELQTRLQHSNAVTYDGIIERALRVLDAASQAGRTVVPFTHLSIDEYQDTNDPQFTIAQALSAQCESIMVVGDDDQAIYSWRGSNMALIHSFGETWPEATVVKLEQNFRSTVPIVEASNRLIAKNANRVPKKCFSSRCWDVEPVYYDLHTDSFEKILSHLWKKGELGKSVAIIARTHRSLNEIVPQLERAGIEYERCNRAGEFFKSREAKQILSPIRLYVNPFDQIALIHAFDALGLGKVQRARIMLEAAETGLPAGVIPFKDCPIDWNGVQWHKHILDHLPAVPVAVKDIFRKWIEYWIMQEAVRYPRPEEFMQWVSLIDLQEGMEADEKKVVHLLTIHAAKGLEFDTVFVIGMNADFPRPGTRDLEEERRCAYVAMTRARDRLYLMHRRTERSSCFIGESQEEL